VHVSWGCYCWRYACDNDIHTVDLKNRQRERDIVDDGNGIFYNPSRYGIMGKGWANVKSSLGLRHGLVSAPLPDVSMAYLDHIREFRDGKRVGVKGDQFSSGFVWMPAENGSVGCNDRALAYLLLARIYIRGSIL
jgi:hypothetical protein